LDLVNEFELKELQKRIKQINPHARIILAKYSNVPVKEIIDLKEFTLDKLSENKAKELKEKTMSVIHDPSVAAILILAKGDLQRDKFEEWIKEMLKIWGHKVYRLKGLLSFENDDGQYIIQGVHSEFNITLHPSKKWERLGELALNKLLLIGKDLDKNSITSSLQRIIHTAYAMTT